MTTKWSFSYNFFVKFHGYFPPLVVYSLFSHNYIYNIEYSPFLTLCHVLCESCFKGLLPLIVVCLGSTIEMDHVISKLCNKGIILQR